MLSTSIKHRIVGIRRVLTAGFSFTLFFGTAHALPSVDWSISLHGGFDDQVYADPERSGVVEPVSEVFGTTRTRLLLRHNGLGRDGDRLEFAAEGSWTTYGDNVPGNDHELAASLRYSRWLSEQAILETNLSALRFRREALSLFDLDQVELEARGSWIGNKPWLLGVTVLHRWPWYHGRYLSEDSDRTEEGRQFGMAGSVQREVGDGGFLNVEIGGRWNRSNAPLVEYRGPIITGRWGIRPGKRFTVVSHTSFGRRVYASYPVLESHGTDLVDTGNRRTDSTYGLGVGIEKNLDRSAKAFADVSLIRQTSNIDALEFDQIRVSVGLQILALNRGGGRRLAIPVMREPDLGDPNTVGGSLVPRWVDGGVLFSHRAPGAKRVSIVGGWNAWNPERSPMSGPDAEGVWQKTIRIPVGIWRFAIVVDGEWVKPYEARRYESDGFGGVNGILQVDGEKVW